MCKLKEIKEDGYNKIITVSVSNVIFENIYNNYFVDADKVNKGKSYTFTLSQISCC